MPILTCYRNSAKRQVRRMSDSIGEIRWDITANDDGLQAAVQKSGQKAESAYSGLFNRLSSKVNKFRQDFRKGVMDGFGANISKEASKASGAFDGLASKARNFKNEFKEGLKEGFLEGLGQETAAEADKAEAELSELEQKIKAILDDSTRSQKSKAAGIASIYKQEGHDASSAFKQAWSHIERSSSTGAENVKRSVRGIGDQADSTAARLKSKLSNLFNRGNGGSVFSGLFGGADKANAAMSSVSNGMSGLIGKAKRLAGALGIAFGLRQLVNFGKQCIELGSDLAEVQNVVDVVFRNMSGKVNSFAQNAATQFGLSETMAKRFMGTFGAMAKSFGFAEQDAYKMSSTLTGLAGDVASFYNITQDAAYTKLKSVFTGETESLKELGIVMTQSALDSYALANGFGNVTSKMSEAEKVALRYAFVQDQLKFATGDFIRTQDGWANQVRILKLQFDSLRASIGQGLMNVLAPVVKAINLLLSKLTTVANAFKSFTELIGGKSSGQSQLSSTSNDLSGLGSAGNDAASGLGSAGDAAGNAGKAAKGAGKAAKQAAKEMKTLLSFDAINKLAEENDSGSGGSGGGGGGSGGSGGGGGAGGILGDIVDYGKAEEGETLFDKYAEKIQKLLDFLNMLKERFKEGFEIGFGDSEKKIDSIKKHLKNLGKNLKEIFTDKNVVGAFTNMCGSWAESLGKFVGSMASIGLSIADGIIGGIDEYIDGSKGYIKKRLASIFNVSADIGEIFGDMSVALARIFDVLDGENAKKAIGEFVGIFSDAFLGVVDLAQKFARDILNVITKPFSDNADKIREALDNTLGPIGTVLETLHDSVKDTFDKINSVYDEHLAPLFNSIRDTFSTVFGNLMDGYNDNIAPVLSKLADGFKKVWEQNVQPIVNNLLDAAGNVFDVIKSLWDSLLSPLLSWVADKVGPVLAPIVDLIGTAAVEAFGWLTDKVKKISEHIKDFSDKLSDAANWVTSLIDKLKEWREGKTDFSLTAKITEWKDEIKDRTIGKMVSKFESWKESLKEKVIEFKAKMSSWSDSLKEKVISFVAKLSSWSDSLKEKVLSFKAKLSSWSDSLSNKVVSFKAKMSSWSDSLSNKVISFKAKMSSWSESLSNKVVNFKAKLTSFQDALKNKVINFTAKLTKWTDNLKNKFINFTAKITGKKAEGGVYKAGKWKPIQQYAAGGSPAGGEMFIAREAGPELVGRMPGGGTGVMNNDQIVASVSAGVYKAVRLAMHAPPLHNVAPAANQTAMRAADIIQQFKEVYDSSNAQMVELLRDILEFLKNMELTAEVSGDDLMNMLVALINRKTQATGECPIII